MPALIIVLSYLLGAVPTAYLIVRWRRGIDLRRYGSGNLGSSNVVTAVSRKWGIVVILLDLAKGMAAVYAARALGLGSGVEATAGLAAIAGHSWSVFLRFQGGRGIMTALGVSFMLAPRLLLVMLAVALLLGLRKQLALGTVITIACLPIGAYFFPELSGVSGDPAVVSLGLAAMFVMTVIRRLAVRRSPIAASLPLREVMLNRFLFDRDIRDREAWIHRMPETAPVCKEETTP